jgi:hypothetical protein
VNGFLEGAEPEVWVSDRLGAQMNHAKAHQVCLGPEAMSKIWMAISEQIAAQVQAQMLAQIPEPFRPFFNMYLKPASGQKP